MRKLLPFLGALPLLAQTGVISSFGRCPGASPAIVMWTGKNFQCVGLGANLTVTSTTINSTSPPTAVPIYQVETITLTALATTATSVSYTTILPPIGGFVIYFYNSPNPLNQAAGAITFGGNPVTFTLPSGWSATDTVTIFYRSQ